MRAAGRLVAMVAGALVLSLTPAGSAAAGVPNDTIDTALAIPRVPYTHVEWTLSADGPPVDTADYCVAPHAVWFKYTATTSADLTASTAGTEYDDTLIGVFDGQPQADPYPSCDYFQVEFSVEAGHTYYIAVGTDAEWPPPRSKLVFHLVTPPTITMFRVHRQAALQSDGSVVVSFTVACSRRLSYLDIYGVALVQRRSGKLVSGWQNFSWAPSSCLPTPTTHQLLVPPSTDGPFVRGRARLSPGQLYGCDQIGSCVNWYTPPQDPVRLWLRPAV